MTASKVLEQKLHQLRLAMRDLADLESIISILGWDQATYMPAQGGAGRGRQLALMSYIHHQRQTDPELGRLLDELSAIATDLPPDSPGAALLRVAHKDFNRAVRVPAEFVARMEEHCANTFEVWKRARPEGNFEAVRPYLETTVELSRELSGFFPGHAHPADPLIDFADEGFTAAYLSELFSELTRHLVPLVDSVCRQPQPDDTFLRRHFPLDRQVELGEAIIRDLGYDFERGRQDTAPHPFMTRLGWNDLRITTRYNPNYLAKGLFGTIHEAGHALYEMGIDSIYDGTPLGTGSTMGTHESQSRLWENLVARSRPFWQHYYPRVRAMFPEQLGDVTVDQFYRAINKVSRSLIRVEADELTYNLHVMIRFELECELLDGRLAVADLPARWNELYESRLKIRPTSDTDGVLQDMHWYQGGVGGEFQSYTLGNIMSAQFYTAASRAHPGIGEEIGRGCFSTLRGWLVEHVYRHGRSLQALDLVERATGEPLNMRPYLDLLAAKYGELYGFSSGWAS